jgi:predicted metal-dependent phosphoesterase TrpH
MRNYTLLMIAVLLAGIFFSSMVDFREQTKVNIDNYSVYCGDLHIHTSVSGDSPASPLAVVFSAKQKGLDFIFVTNHNTVIGSKAVQKFAELYAKDFLAIVGEEVTTPKWHVLALGISETIPPTHPLNETAALIHAQGGLAIGNHPTKKYSKALLPAFEEGVLDGVEALNFGPVTEGRQGEVEDFLSKLDSEGILKNITQVGTSDSHFVDTIGNSRTCVLAENLTQASIMNALKEHRNAIGFNGEFRGGEWKDILNEKAKAKLETHVPDWMKVASYLLYAVIVLGMLLLRI